jgi:hypothetical protein
MEAAHTLNTEILKERKGGEGLEDEDGEDSGEDSEDSCAQDRKPNVLFHPHQHHQHENKDDLREGCGRIFPGFFFFFNRGDIFRGQKDLLFR